MSYDNEMAGALFPNNKEGNEGRPDFKGTATINGQEYDVAAWNNTSKAGKNYMKLSFQIPRKKDESVEAAPAAVQAQMNDEIPF